MKNSLKIFLIVASICLWGLIGVRVYNYYNKDIDMLPTEKRYSDIPIIKNIQPKHVLQLNYIDPFLNQNSSNKITRIAYSKLAAVKPTKVINWPEIHYKGVISTNGSKIKIGLFNILNEEYLLKENAIIFGCEVLKLYNDSSILLFHNQKKLFVKD